MLSKLKSKLTERNEQGFTIIEVVLVLAIAGLIFLVVFLAVPQLQRSQRDSQRTSDLGRLMTALENYASNNNGQYPEPGDPVAFEEFVNNYIKTGNSEFADPSTGEDYNPNLGTGEADIQPNDTISQNGATMYYRDQAQCDGESIAGGFGGRQIAVAVELENGVAFCQDNN